MILVVLNYTFLYLDRLFFSFSFFQKQTSLNSCGTISLYEICLNLSFWVTENRINGLWYLQCLRWRDSLFGNILSFTHPSVAKLTRYQTTWQPLAGVMLGLQGINWSIDHIRVKRLYVTEFIYTFTSCQKKYQALS